MAEGDLLAEPPDWMSDGQQAGWRYAVEHAPAGILKYIDRGMLAIWVVAEDDHRRAVMSQARIDQGSALPMLTKDGKGNPAVSPYHYIQKNSAMLMIKAGSELGFSPAARPRLSGGEERPEADSPWDELRVIVGGKSA